MNDGFFDDVGEPLDDIDPGLWAGTAGLKPWKKRLIGKARRHELGHAIVAWHFSVKDPSQSPFGPLEVKATLDLFGNADGSIRLWFGRLVPSTANVKAAVCLAGLFAEREPHIWSLAKWRRAIAWHSNQVNSRLSDDLDVLAEIAKTQATSTDELVEMAFSTLTALSVWDHVPALAKWLRLKGDLVTPAELATRFST